MAKAKTRRRNPRTKAGRLTDELGNIRAAIAVLQIQEEEIKTELINLGIEEADGKLFHATVSRSEVAKVDWRSVAEYLQPTKRLLRKFTTVKERVQVLVRAR